MSRRTSVPPSRRKLFLASSNAGKLRELALASLTLEAPTRPTRARRGRRSAFPRAGIEAHLLPHFDQLPRFAEGYPSFALNAAGKALHFSRLTKGLVLADDSGLAVDALGGAPGIGSARYAGVGASDADRIGKLLEAMKDLPESLRGARFICVLALAQREQLIALFSDFVEGQILTAPRGRGGFGYDPIFFYVPLKKTFAEISRAEKNVVSHRGKAFHRLVAFLRSF